MKIAHISDIHLGYSSGRKRHEQTKVNLREQDGYDALEYCITEIINAKPDFVLCTGDFFHSPLPSIYTIVQGQNQLRRLYEAGIPFYNLAGNHDSTDAVKDIPSNRVLHNPELNIYSHTDPYVVETIENIKIHMVSHHGFIDQKKTFENVEPIEGYFNILATHGSVYDESIMGILHSEAEPREIVIPETLIKKDWDYILMGHIHERGWVGSDDRVSDTTGNKTFYGGSLIRRGFSDKECKLNRGWTLWSVDGSNMTPEFFDCPQREQLDITIDCDNKSIVDIEQSISDSFKNIDFDKNPILRITLDNIEKAQKSSVNWKQFEEQTSKCLTFTARSNSKAEKKISEDSVNGGFNLLEAYSEFWKDAKVNYKKSAQKDIEKSAKDYLKAGQDTILSKEV